MSDSHERFRANGFECKGDGKKRTSPCRAALRPSSPLKHFQMFCVDPQCWHDRFESEKGSARSIRERDRYVVPLDGQDAQIDLKPMQHLELVDVNEIDPMYLAT
jgi:hypothetical protein